MFRWLSQATGKIIHVPTILVSEIQEWPEVIEIVKKYTEEGLCSPQLHGYQHIDYGNKSGMVVPEIAEHLEKCMDWFSSNLKFEPTVWATPWGADSPNIREAAALFDLKVETTHGTSTPGNAIKLLKKGANIDGINIMDHWWKRGINLIRLVEIIKIGSYKTAIKERKDLFNE